MPSSGACTPHLPTETAQGMAVCVRLHYPGAWAVCSRANCEALETQMRLEFLLLDSAWKGSPTFSWSARAPCFRMFFLAR